MTLRALHDRTTSGRATGRSTATLFSWILKSQLFPHLGDLAVLVEAERIERERREAMLARPRLALLVLRTLLRELLERLEEELRLRRLKALPLRGVKRPLLSRGADAATLLLLFLSSGFIVSLMGFDLKAARRVDYGVCLCTGANLPFYRVL